MLPTDTGSIAASLDRLLRAPGPLRGGVVDWLRPGWSSGSMNVADLAIQAAIAVLVVAAVQDLIARPRSAQP